MKMAKICRLFIQVQKLSLLEHHNLSFSFVHVFCSIMLFQVVRTLLSRAYPTPGHILNCALLRQFHASRKLHFLLFASSHQESSVSVSQSSSSSVSSSSAAGDGCFGGGLLRVAGLPKGSSRLGGGRPSVSGVSSLDDFVTEVDLSFWDRFCIGAETSSSVSVSSSEGSGVAAGTSSSLCSSSLAWSISIWSLSDSSFTSGSAACTEALRLDWRDVVALCDFASFLDDFTAVAVCIVR